MKSRPFSVGPKDDERSELLRRLAAALEPKPLKDGKTLSDKKGPPKSTDQE